MNVTLTDEGYTMDGKWRLVPVDADAVTISRTLTPEAWKRLCNADIWPVTPKSFQRMLDVLADVAAVKSAPNPPAELAVTGKPVAMVDAGDDGYFAEILPDCSVSVGDKLYAFPPLNVDRELWIESFGQWWEAHGQYLRAGGGQYEKTFGYHAWEAAAALYASQNPPQSLSSIPPDCRTCINRGHINGLSQETYCDSCMWYGAYWKKNNYNPLPEPAP